VSFETEQLAWVVLEAANRTQAKSRTVRLVVPRDPELLNELSMTLSDEALLSAEEYLEDQGYIALVDIQLTRGTFTITPAGFKWLERGLPEPPEAPETPAEPSEGTATRGAREEV
jgi:hypothetical protein